MTGGNLADVIKSLRALETKVRVYEDVELIKQLSERYINARNDGKPEDQIACLSEDVVLEVGAKPIKGKNAVAEIVRGHAPKAGTVQPAATKMSSFIVHPLISVEGDKAKGNWLLYVMHCLTATYQSLFWVQQIHEFEYVRENGEWKISYIKMIPKLGPPHPAPTNSH